MNVIAVDSAVTIPHHIVDDRRGTWGMLLFILTEACLFVLLFFSYFYLARLVWRVAAGAAEGDAGPGDAASAASHPMHTDATDRVEFMALGGVLVSSAFAIGIVWAGLSSIFLNACGRVR